MPTNTTYGPRNPNMSYAVPNKDNMTSHAVQTQPAQNPMQPWDKWIYDRFAQGVNSPPPISSNNGMINPAPNTNQMSFAKPPKAPTTYVPTAPAIPNAVPSANATAPTGTPASTTTNPQGLTAQQMGQLAQQQMQDRVIAQSMSNPGTVAQGAQTGVLPDGTPITFQSYVNPQSVINAQNGVLPPGETQMGVQQNQVSGASGVSGTSNATATGTAEQQFVYDPAQGGYVPADTSAIDSKLEEYYDPQKKIEIAQQELDITMSGIKTGFEDDLRNAMRDFENRKQAQFSALAGIGTGVNPLSSAGQSVANSNETLFQDYKHNLEMERSAREAIAQKTFLGQKADAETNYIKYLEDQRKDMIDTADKNYKRSVDAQNDLLNRIMKTKQIAKMDRDATTEEQNQVVETMTDYFEMAGSGAFADFSDAEKLAFERKAGKPAGYINAAITKLKQQEEKVERPTMKQVGNSVMQYRYNEQTGTYELVQRDQASGIKTIGGKVYNVTYDENGNPRMELVPGSPTGTGTGTGTGTLPKGFDTDAQTQLNNLAQGKQVWGQAFDTLKAQYPQVPNEIIDTFLNKEKWGVQGAYEDFKNKNPFGLGSLDLFTPAPQQVATPTQAPAQDGVSLDEWGEIGT